MNIVDKQLQKQLPNNALLMIVSSLAALFSAIQIVFIHTDILVPIGTLAFLISIEDYFAAYNFRWKEVRLSIILNFLMMLSEISVGIYLNMDPTMNSDSTNNPDQYTKETRVYGVCFAVGGGCLFGLSSILAYYFYRLFPTGESGGIRSVDPHLFDEVDMMKRLEEIDNIKPPGDITINSFAASQGFSSQLSTSVNYY